jgi:sulfotransferase
MGKNIHFISGLPRSGSTLITNVLKQNPSIHGEAVSSLSSIFSNINSAWNNIEANQEYPNESAKRGTLNSVLQGYYSHIDKPIVMDRDRKWISLIPQIESVIDRQCKMIVCVRNPAEILASFERLRKDNPLFQTRADAVLREGSSITSRAYYYAGPDGELGLSHRNLKDAVTMGYLDRLLFVDYNRYCNSPKSQTKRIYEFLELPHFEHDFENIVQTEQYNDLAVGLPNLHKIKPSLDRTTVNCVEYLGLELYEQYNREIFWTPWI